MTASIGANAQWLNMGNTLQRSVDGTGFKYRFNLGSPGFWNVTDSIRSRAPLTGGSGYIWNQNAYGSAQLASMYINGVGRFGNNYINTGGTFNNEFSAATRIGSGGSLVVSAANGTAGSETGGKITSQTDGGSSSVSIFTQNNGNVNFQSVGVSSYDFDKQIYLPGTAGYYFHNVSTKLVPGNTVLEGNVLITSAGSLQIDNGSLSATVFPNGLVTNHSSFSFNKPLLNVGLSVFPEIGSPTFVNQSISGTDFNFNSSSGITRFGFSKQVQVPSLNITTNPSTGSNSDQILTRNGTTGDVRAVSFSSVSPDLSNYVDRTTSQTIGGVKTFSNAINGNLNGNATTAGVADDAVRLNGYVATFNPIISAPIQAILGTNGTSINRYDAASVRTFLGVSNTTPTLQQVTTAGNTTSNSLYLQTTLDVYSLTIGDVSAGNSNLRISGSAGGSSGVSLLDSYKGDTPSQLVFQRNGGNVGIGTTTTPSKLTVAGDVESVGSANGVILTAPNGSRWRITVSNTGVLSTTAL